VEIETSIYGISVPAALLRQRRVRPAAAIADPEGIARVADALIGATSPLILAGAGVLVSDTASALADLAHLTSARLATTLRVNQMFSGDPHDIGLCGGWSPAPVRSSLAETDVVIAAGASLNHYTMAEGRAFPNASIYHLDVSPQPGLAAVRGDLRRTVPALRAAVEERMEEGAGDRPTPQVPRRETILESVFSVPYGHDPSRGIDPLRLYERLDAILPEDRIVVTDTGRFLGTIPTIIRARDALSWLDGNSFSAIGLGLGTALGAASANPERPVVLITGDGGLTLASHDLVSIATNRLSLTVVVVNDRQLGSEAKYLRALSLPDDAIKLDMPDAVLLARAVGGEGVVVESLEQLERIDFRRSGLQLVDVRVDPEVDVRSVIARWAA
jgi:thiamine pyrophosphate-dependent acetolactate synthase large subunit-like protein